MGLSSLEFNFLHQAHRQGHLPRGGSILEFGECDTVALDVHAALKYILPDGAARDGFLQQALALNARNDAMSGYDKAKLVYRALFDYSSYAAIDLEPGGAHRITQDLNLPFNLGRQYDICINNGTSEHLFNQANFYKAVHDHTRAGGVMIHWTPCLGWHDHGFYNVQPSFFHDLARGNEYDMLIGKLVTDTRIHDLVPMTSDAKVLEANPDLKQALACVVMRKRNDAEFQMPLQGAFTYLERYQQVG